MEATFHEIQAAVSQVGKIIARLVLQDLPNSFVGKFIIEGEDARQELIADDSDGPDVYLLRVAALEHLGSLVGQGASYRPHFELLVLIFYHFRNTKVNELHISSFRVVEDVFGLDVAMAHSNGMQIGDNFEEGVEDLRSFILGRDRLLFQINS